uniref:hypothetical protein n=1 Tax=Coelastrella saipanensis TaxID=152631 RepID=UPI0010C4FF8D|nr:hypothetical protein [Coelastrella saipanensis]AVV61555.1 hypothetical protein [Coelastrella saipanensis]
MTRKNISERVNLLLRVARRLDWSGFTNLIPERIAPILTRNARSFKLKQNQSPSTIVSLFPLSPKEILEFFSKIDELNQPISQNSQISKAQAITFEVISFFATGNSWYQTYLVNQNNFSFLKISKNAHRALCSNYYTPHNFFYRFAKETVSLNATLYSNSIMTCRTSIHFQQQFSNEVDNFLKKRDTDLQPFELSIFVNGILQNFDIVKINSESMNLTNVETAFYTEFSKIFQETSNVFFEAEFPLTFLNWLRNKGFSLNFNQIFKNFIQNPLYFPIFQTFLNSELGNETNSAIFFYGIRFIQVFFLCFCLNTRIPAHFSTLENENSLQTVFANITPASKNFIKNYYKAVTCFTSFNFFIFHSNSAKLEIENFTYLQLSSRVFYELFTWQINGQQIPENILPTLLTHSPDFSSFCSKSMPNGFNDFPNLTHVEQEKVSAAFSFFTLIHIFQTDFENPIVNNNSPDIQFNKKFFLKISLSIPIFIFPVTTLPITQITTNQMSHSTKETLENVASSNAVNTRDTVFSDLDPTMYDFSEYIYIIGQKIFIKFNSIKIFVVEYCEEFDNLYLLAFVILQLKNLIKEHLNGYVQPNFQLNSVSIKMRIPGTAFLFGNTQSNKQDDVFFRKRKQLEVIFFNNFFSSSLSDLISLLKSELTKLISSENRSKKNDTNSSEEPDEKEYTDYNMGYFLSDNIRFEISSPFLSYLLKTNVPAFSTFKKTLLLKASKMSFSANNLWSFSALNTKDTTTNFTSAHGTNPNNSNIDNLREVDFSEIMSDIILSNTQSNSCYTQKEIQNLLFKKKILDNFPFSRLIYKKISIRHFLSFLTPKIKKNYLV